LLNIRELKVIKVKRIKDQRFRFISAFDLDTGMYYRSSIIDENGKTTGTDPFQGSYPHLLDIGIMGHCKHGESGLCLEAGIQCYQDGLHIHQENMSIKDYKKIIDESQGKLFQVALGGRGDPEDHETIEAILKYTINHDIVPNITTSGLSMTSEKANLLKKYCGAVAVSWYRSPYTLKAIEYLLEAKVRTNIHYVLSRSTLEEAIDRIENDGFPKGINRVVFLLHKPVGLGTKEEVLEWNNPRVQYFFKLFNQEKYNEKAGFDSCSIPAILQLAPEIATASIDTCEGARFSAYITPNMKMIPCSFDQREHFAIDLIDNTIQEAWDSDSFEAFRNVLQNSCTECTLRRNCYGGCPITNEIVLCQRKERNHES